MGTRNRVEAILPEPIAGWVDSYVMYPCWYLIGFFSALIYLPIVKFRWHILAGGCLYLSIHVFGHKATWMTVIGLLVIGLGLSDGNGGGGDGNGGRDWSDRCATYYKWHTWHSR